MTIKFDLFFSGCNLLKFSSQSFNAIAAMDVDTLQVEGFEQLYNISFKRSARHLLQLTPSKVRFVTLQDFLTES